MDYTAILKKSWNLTWRYKILWLFGLFAGAGGGGSANVGQNMGNSDSGSGLPGNVTAAQAQAFAERYAVVLIVAALFIIVLGLLMWVLAVAARGGLIHLVNEAEEGREVRAAAGWSAGFSKWWRVFGTGFLADLPVAIVLLVMFVFLAVAGFGAWAASRGSGEAVAAALATSFAGLCIFGAVFFIAAIVLGLIFGIVKELALRYVVIEDLHIVAALRAGWRDLWAKRGAFTMYLIQVGVSIAFGMVVALIAAIMIVPAVVMLVVGNTPGGVLMIIVAAFILMLPSAIYAAFYHTVWTVFFRRMTGMEKAIVVDATVVGYPPVQPAPPMPEATFVPEAPPAPPVPPAAPGEADV